MRCGTPTPPHAHYSPCQACRAPQTPTTTTEEKLLRIIKLTAENFKRLQAVEITPGGNLIVISGRNGQGKQHPVSEPVLTPDGWRPIGQIQVGDEVIGSAGVPVKVTGVFPQETREVWSVITADGGVVRCGPDHLWSVSRWRDKRWSTETLTTAEIIRIGVRMNKGASRRWAVPIVAPVSFAQQTDALPIKPWVLGVLLGDANISDTGYVQLTTDAEIIDRIDVTGYRRNHGSSVGIDVLGTAKWSFRLEALGLAGKLSDEKFIPAVYLRATPTERAELLAGLLDTDGHPLPHPTGVCEFSTTSPALAEGVVELVRSLGGTATMGSPTTKKYTYNGEKREGKPAIRVRVKMPTQPFTLSRKAARWIPADDRRPLRRFIDRIERADDEDSVCIAVDAEDGLYVASDYIVTHNTSVLDAIWQAIGGGPAAKGTSKPIRDGEDQASVTVDLGDLKVTRTWRGDRTTLKVENADGARYSSPQAVLDKLVGKLSFDPLAFAQQSDRDQLSTLIDLIDLPFDLDDLTRQRQHLYDERTGVNRAVKHLEAQVSASPEPAADLPDVEVSVSDLMRRLRTARDAATAQQASAGREQALYDSLRRTRARIEQMREELARLEAEGKNLAIALVAARNEIAIDQTAPADDVAALERQISEADGVNRAVRAAKDRAATVIELGHSRETSQTLTDDIAALDTRRAQAVAEARMPIDGLGFDEQGVTYRGIPFAQCSSAERLRVSMAMAMAMNPTLRVIRITDGSLLDSDGMRLVEQMATDGGWQVWVERVDDSGSVGVVIEDGQVAESVDADNRSASRP